MSKTVDKLAERIYQLEASNTIQTMHWNGECAEVSHIRLKKVILAVLEHLDLDMDGKMNVLCKKEKVLCKKEKKDA